ncbi:MAG: hypothetical protein KAW39_08360 [Thermoplasmata archaeon]|nr:hypothetical protein [Thermoplasmata archaeon]
MKRFYCPKCRYGMGNVRPIYVREYEEENRNGKFTPLVVRGSRQCYCTLCDAIVPALTEKPPRRSLKKRQVGPLPEEYP